MNDINIIDIEASGLGFESYPIEIAILINGQSKFWLIRPEPDWLFWSSNAEDMHGISREKLYDHGICAKQVARELDAFLGNSSGILYSDAAYWDADWIDILYISINQKRQFHIDSIYELFYEQQSSEFNENKWALAKSDKYRQHRAEEDVRMIFEASTLYVK